MTFDRPPCKYDHLNKALYFFATTAHSNFHKGSLQLSRKNKNKAKQNKYYRLKGNTFINCNY